VQEKLDEGATKPNGVVSFGRNKKHKQLGWKLWVFAGLLR